MTFRYRPMAAWKWDKASASCPAANSFFPISSCFSTSAFIPHSAPGGRKQKLCQQLNCDFTCFSFPLTSSSYERQGKEKTGSATHYIRSGGKHGMPHPRHFSKLLYAWFSTGTQDPDKIHRTTTKMLLASAIVSWEPSRGGTIWEETWGDHRRVRDSQFLTGPGGFGRVCKGRKISSTGKSYIPGGAEEYRLLYFLSLKL